MNKELEKDYNNSLNFWNMAYAMDDTMKEQEKSEINPDTDLRKLAPSEKLFNAAASLGTGKKVLDYGCGDGWAGIIAAKSGCRDVTSVDVTANGAAMADFYVKLFKADDRVHVSHVTTDWITKEPGNKYDGFICSNVLDVVPAEVAQKIIENIARIVTDDAVIVIGMNYYAVPHEDSRRNETVKFQNHIYVDGILRMVSRTDEEWCRIFEKYFVVAKTDHFAWENEPEEKRRLFYLRKKLQ